MKRNKWTLCVGYILPLMATACIADAPVEMDKGYGLVEINLNGEIGSVTSSSTTKASLQGMINGGKTWANDLTVSFARADAASNAYTAYQTASLTADVKKEAAANTHTHQISFASSTYYQADGQNTKLIGWYPVVGSGDSFDATNHKVTFAAATMDGETDYMVTDLVEGNKSAATQIKSVTFSHLLMKLSVKVYAEDANVQKIWGGIKSITINGVKQTCEVTLPAATADASDAKAKQATVVFGNASADLPLVKKNFSDNAAISYNESTPLTLGLASANANLAGYAMFAPQESKNITLTVATETGGTQKPVVKAPSGGFLAGYSYEVVLKFSATGIAPTVTIKDWAAGTNPGEVII